MLAIAPLVVPECLARRIMEREVWFRTQTEIIAAIPGITGIILRSVYYHLMLRRCPLSCRFKLGTVINSQAEFGERVWVGRYVEIGEATIEDDCMIAAGAQILPGKFSHGINSEQVPFQEQPGTVSRVRLGRNCWIGANAVVMADLGENCVVGAGAVVTREFPDGKIILGNPARPVADTFNEKLIEARKAKSKRNLDIHLSTQSEI